jgi:hypothetical protein
LSLRQLLRATVTVLLYFVTLSVPTFGQTTTLQPSVGPGFNLILPAGSLTTNPAEVIAGNASIKGSYSGTNTFTSYLQTNPSVVHFTPGRSYRVSSVQDSQGFAEWVSGFLLFSDRPVPR